MLTRTQFEKVATIFAVLVLLQQHAAALSVVKVQHRNEGAPVESDGSQAPLTLRRPRQVQLPVDDAFFLDSIEEGKASDTHEGANLKEFRSFEQQVRNLNASQSYQEFSRRQQSLLKLLRNLPPDLRSLLKHLIADGAVDRTRGSAAAAGEGAELPTPVQLVRATMNSGLRR